MTFVLRDFLSLASTSSPVCRGLLLSHFLSNLSSEINPKDGENKTLNIHTNCFLLTLCYHFLFLLNSFSLIRGNFKVIFLFLGGKINATTKTWLVSCGTMRQVVSCMFTDVSEAFSDSIIRDHLPNNVGAKHIRNVGNFLADCTA